MRFKKKLTVVEAWQWDGETIPPAPSAFLKRTFTGKWKLRTLEGWVFLKRGDWILKGPHIGEWWPVKPDIFAATYEAVEE